MSGTSFAQELTAQNIIETLKLEKHVEGGYFRRTFEANHRKKVSTPLGERLTMTSIYYLLTQSSPIGHFHLNKSDIAHFFHAGDSINYVLIGPNGELETFTLGNNLAAGEVFQYVVPGGWWKASSIDENGELGFGLISEAVSPGFEYADMTLAERETLIQAHPKYELLIKNFTRE